MAIFLAKLNGLKLWTTDIGNAYVEAKTKENIVIVTGNEFGKLTGHLLIVEKDLYTFRSNGLFWHERLSDFLQELGFFPCRAEPDIWLRPNGDKYEYVAVHVDDLEMPMEDTEFFVNNIMTKFKFRLKDTRDLIAD